MSVRHHLVLGYSHVPHDVVSINDVPHIWRWCTRYTRCVAGCAVQVYVSALCAVRTTTQSPNDTFLRMQPRPIGVWAHDRTCFSYFLYSVCVP